MNLTNTFHYEMRRIFTQCAHCLISFAFDLIHSIVHQRLPLLHSFQISSEVHPDPGVKLQFHSPPDVFMAWSVQYVRTRGFYSWKTAKVGVISLGMPGDNSVADPIEDVYREVK
jgi:hypothetical protein